MALPLEKKDRPFSYGDYCTWPEEERWEIVNGIPINMGPTPMRRHQKILRALDGEFHRAEQAGLIQGCEVYFAPFDVRLPESDEADEDVTTVVQPDLVLVCDRAKLDDRGCRGAPDLVVEILSPSSAARDAKLKLTLYEKHGVREYWIVYPGEKVVMAFLLKDGSYQKGDVYTDEDEVSLSVLPDVRISLRNIFEGA